MHTTDHDQSTAQIEHPRDLLHQLIAATEKNTAEISATRAELASVHELLNAWNSARGAIKVVYAIGNTIRWITLVSAAATAAWLSIKYAITMKG